MLSFSAVMVNFVIKENWWKKPFISAYTSRCLREVRVGAEAEAGEECGLLASFVAPAQLVFLNSPSPPAQII